MEIVILNYLRRGSEEKSGIDLKLFEESYKVSDEELPVRSLID